MKINVPFCRNPFFCIFCFGRPKGLCESDFPINISFLLRGVEKKTQTLKRFGKQKAQVQVWVWAPVRFFKFFFAYFATPLVKKLDGQQGLWWWRPLPPQQWPQLQRSFDLSTIPNFICCVCVFVFIFFGGRLLFWHIACWLLYEVFSCYSPQYAKLIICNRSCSLQVRQCGRIKARPHLTCSYGKDPVTWWKASFAAQVAFSLNSCLFCGAVGSWEGAAGGRREPRRTGAGLGYLGGLARSVVAIETCYTYLTTPMFWILF